MQIGCCGIADQADTIRRMGYDYLELSGVALMSMTEGERRDLADFSRLTGFPVPSVNAYAGADHPLVGPKRRPDDVRSYAAELMKRAHLLGVRGIGIGAPAARRLAPDFPYNEADVQMRENLHILSEEAAPYGMTILLEALHTGTCEYLNHTIEAARMVRELSLSNVSLVYDRYHTEVMGEDLQPLRDCLPFVKHLHYSSNLGPAHERGFLTEQEYDGFAAFLQAARAGGYDGKISVEADNRRLEADGEACERLMRKAVNETGRKV